MMPVMDGEEFLDLKRKASELAQIPVVLISADGQLERKARELHVEGYLQKPVHLDALLSTVARHCSARAISAHIKL
jgi:CheY-like chemotaxis protein